MINFSRSIVLIVALFVSACGPMSAEESKDLWGPIGLENWRTTSVTKGRVANEDDVNAGRAVFYVNGASEAHIMPLPSLARRTGSGSPEELVVIIQAEVVDQGVILGVRPLSGGNAVVTLEEVEVLSEQD